jgi:hypothetical protein
VILNDCTTQKNHVREEKAFYLPTGTKPEFAGLLDVCLMEKI